MIKAENISRAINSKPLFKNISFELQNKRITGLLGANGAGKTSLFKALAGLTKIDQGTLSFFGNNLNSMNLEERSNAGLNYVPQENSLFDDLTLVENLEAVIELKYSTVSEKKIFANTSTGKSDEIGTKIRHQSKIFIWWGKKKNRNT